MELVNRPQDIAILNAPSLEDLVNSFISSEDVKKNSKDLYRRTLKQFFIWIEEKSYLLKEIARPHIIEYKENLLSDGKSSLTVGSYLTSVRKFYEWAEANKYYPNVAKGIKTPKRSQQFKKQPLTPEEAKQLVAYFDTQSLRDCAIVNLLIRTGLRTIEVVRANIEDITFKGSQRVLLVHGKGRDEKDNFVILTDKTYLPIAKYLESRGDNGSEPLFSSTSNNSKGGRLTTRTISKIAKEGLKAIGLDNKLFTAHSLRHTTAVNILRAGGNLETAQGTLRHASMTTTQIYTKTLEEERRLQNSGEALLDNLY